MKKFISTLSFVIVSTCIFAQYDVDLDSIRFEPVTEYITIGQTVDNIWQIGSPEKQFMNTAFSLPNAIVTDTVGFYPVNNHSYFDLYLGAFNFGSYYPDNIHIDFMHKYNTQSGMDGGYISVSYDNGQTFMNILRDVVYPGSTPHCEHRNLYAEADTLYNGESGYSGNSGDLTGDPEGWVLSSIGWVAFKKDLLSIGDTMIVRFNFLSDGNDSDHEGWLIDNIRLYAVDYTIATGKASKVQFAVYPNPANDNINIQFEGQQKGSIVELTDLEGRSYGVRTLSEGNQLVWKRGDLKSGVYLLRISSESSAPFVQKIIFR